MTNKRELAGDPQIIQQLASTDFEIVLQALDKLRNAGNTSYLPNLFALFRSDVPAEVKSKVRELLADVKKKEMVELLVDAIKNPVYAEGRAEIVSLCWQNGLDFTAYLSSFVDLLLGDNLLVAFEAYTVILNIEGKLDAALVSATIDRIESEIPKKESGQAELLRDIVDFLSEQGIVQ